MHIQCQNLLKELRNRILRTILVRSLSCLIRLYQFRKTNRFPLIWKVLLQLLSLQLCLVFFLKRWNYIKTWISRTSAEIFFSPIDVINVSKIKYIYCYFTENTSMDFRKVLCRSAFPTVSFRKLVFRLFMLSLNQDIKICVIMLCNFDM